MDLGEPTWWKFLGLICCGFPLAVLIVICLGGVVWGTLVGLFTSDGLGFRYNFKEGFGAGATWTFLIGWGLIALYGLFWLARWIVRWIGEHHGEFAQFLATWVGIIGGILGIVATIIQLRRRN